MDIRLILFAVLLSCSAPGSILIEKEDAGVLVETKLVCQGRQCGVIEDKLSGLIVDCGECGEGLVCGDNGIQNICGSDCIPRKGLACDYWNINHAGGEYSAYCLHDPVLGYFDSCIPVSLLDQPCIECGYFWCCP